MLERRGRDRRRGRLPADAAPRLLLLVTADTLRADHVDAFGGPPGLTPRIDALARESVAFENAYAAAPLTLPSLASLFTGWHPEELGIRSNEAALPDSAPTLAGDLRERGWRTAAVVGNFVLRRASGLARGFDRYDDDLTQREAVRRWPERIARETTDAALAVLDACAAERCFVWVHYQDPHGPYDPPPGVRERHLPAAGEAPDARRRLPVGRGQAGLGEIPAYQVLAGRRDVAFYRAGYRGEVEYVDAQIGRLLDGVRERRLWERSVVVFAADHGESLGEQEVWFAHGENLGDAQVRVPLLLRVPGREASRRGELASLADLRATLLALLAPGADVRGRDLLGPGAERAASRPYLATLRGSEVPRFGLVEGGYKLVVSELDAGERVARLRGRRTQMTFPR